MSVVLTAWNMGLIVGPAVGGRLSSYLLQARVHNKLKLANLPLLKIKSWQSPVFTPKTSIQLNLIFRVLFS